MKTNREIKKIAKEQTRANFGALLLIEIVLGLVNSAASSIAGATVIGSILVFCIAPTYTICRNKVYLNLAERGEKPKLEDSFSCLDNFWSATKTYLLQALYLTLWWLLIIPGIVKTFSYSQAFFIVTENKGIGGNEAITSSRKMMDGHKWQYFMLNLSFIGWIFLVILTFGIAAIWVVPYMQAAMTNFYISVRDEYQGVAPQQESQPEITVEG